MEHRILRVALLLSYGGASSMWAYGAAMTAAAGRAHWTVLPVMMLMFCGWMLSYNFRKLAAS